MWDPVYTCIDTLLYNKTVPLLLLALTLSSKPKSKRLGRVRVGGRTLEHRETPHPSYVPHLSLGNVLYTTSKVSKYMETQNSPGDGIGTGRQPFDGGATVTMGVWSYASMAAGVLIILFLLTVVLGISTLNRVIDERVKCVMESDRKRAIDSNGDGAPSSYTVVMNAPVARHTVNPLECNGTGPDAALLPRMKIYSDDLDALEALVKFVYVEDIQKNTLGQTVISLALAMTPEPLHSTQVSPDKTDP